jgi:hypothetical protein
VGRRWWVGMAMATMLAASLGPALVARANGTGGGPGRVVCRSFAYDPRKAPEIDSHDDQSELGRWVREREDRGWQVESVRPEVVVRATGTVEAWAHACVVPTR